MSWFNKLFGKSEESSTPPALDPLRDLVLDKMQAGYLVDYDGRTWEVLARHESDLGDGHRTVQWELRSDRDIRFLHREEADGVYWTLTRKIPIGAIDENLRRYIQDHNDPPETLEHEGNFFTMRSYGGAKFYKDGRDPSQPFLFWDYDDDSGEHTLTIEQWGDIEFEAFVGDYVEEYQFINILPGQRNR